MKYLVRIYAVCRRTVLIEDAESQAEAVKRANAMDMNQLFSYAQVEFADEVQDFYVDEVGDTDYGKSCLWVINDKDEPELERGLEHLGVNDEVRSS
ncbi:MAG: hypothetical protein PHI12_08375 [Dehalococcoidales bacterium]|nr:hypothetical protein [Dehalococcoidales bacterium]